MMTGYEYHRYTAYSRLRLGGKGWIRGGRPELFKKYRGAKTVSLPERLSMPQKGLCEIMCGPLQGEEAIISVDSDMVGLLLFLSYGIRPDSKIRGYPFRMVPSAGALYPCELYFFSDAVRDLERGFYHYRADFHGIECVALGCGSDGSLDVKVSVLPYRSACKYGERALRYVLLDAGHLIEQVRMAGRICGLYGFAYSGCDKPSFWETAAGLNRDHEVFIGGVRFGKDYDCRDIRPVMDLLEMQRFSELASGGDCGRTIREVLHSVAGASLFYERDRGMEKRPQDDFPDINALEALIKRRSRRDYTGKAISRNVFDLLVRFIGSISGYPGTVLYFVVENVENFANGVYLLGIEEAAEKGVQALTMVRSGAFMKDLARACLGQGWIGSGSFAVVIGLNEDDADGEYGNSGYMHIVMNAGRIGQRIYIFSEGFDLGCCGVGAFYDDDVSSVVGMDNRTHPVYVIPVGSRTR